MITKDHDTIHAVQRCIPVTKNTPCYTNICLFLQQTNPIYLPKYLQTLLNWVVLSRSIKLQLIVIKLKNCSLLKQHKCFSVKSKCLHCCKEDFFKIKQHFTLMVRENGRPGDCCCLESCKFIKCCCC